MLHLELQAFFVCQKVALLLCGLEMEALSVGDCTRWRTKPKVHLMEELVEYQTVEHGSPCEYWTYKDARWACGCPMLLREGVARALVGVWP